MIYWIRKTKTAFALFSIGLFFASQVSAQDELTLADTLNGPDMAEVLPEFELASTPMEGVLDSLAALTGRAIIRPQSLPKPEITFNPGGPITRGELILAIETLLSLNGIGVSPMGDRFLKIVPLTNISSEAPELVTDSLIGRNPSGQVVSKLFRLKYLDSQSFQTQIQPFLSSFHSIIPFQNSNAVIVTDTVSNLQRLEYVVSEVDKPSKLNIETVFYTLQYAQASEVAQQIQSMIDDARTRFGDPSKPSENGGNASVDTPVPDPVVAGGDGQLSAQVLFGSNTAIASDDRTNQLILMTAPGNLTFFEEIIDKLDVQADPSTRIEVIALQYADATEVASLLSQFVTGKTSSDGGDRSAADSNQPGERRNTFGDGPSSIPSPQPRVPTTQVSSVVTQSSGEDRDSQFSSFMTIVAEERSNSLVISGTRSDLELMSALVADIDILLPQVRIEVIIAEVTLGKGINRGMDAFNLSYVLDPVTGISRLVTKGLDVLGIGIDGTVSYEDGDYELISFDSVLKQARNDNSVNLLSVPTIVTTHNKEASLIVGESRPIITGTQTGSTFGNRSSVQYKDVGIDLTVTPLIGPNNVIQLEIDQKIDDILGNVKIDENDQPIIGRRETTSYVSVKSGEVVVLGGLQKEKADDTRARLSLFGEIPLLGKLFRNKTKRLDRTELLLFIRPLVLRGTDAGHKDAIQKLEQHQISEKIERFIEEGTVFSNDKPNGNKKSSTQSKGSRK